MPKIGPLELVIILVIVLMIFGLGRLPQVGSAIGKAVRSVRNSQADDGEEKKVKKASGMKKGKAARKTAVARLPAKDETQST